MSYERAKTVHLDVAINMASHMINELDGINDLKLENWIYYNDIDYLKKCVKPHKKTLLHNYIEDIYITNDNYLLDKHVPMVLINEMKKLFDSQKKSYESLGEFEYFGYEDDHIPYNELRKVEAYAEKMQQLFIEEIMPSVVDDVFTVLYSSKNFLHEFNRQLSEIICKLKYKDHPLELKEDGVISRSYIPKWLKDGVFHRDKGRCQICGTDLTKILILDEKDNYDHIIPLQSSGTNDPTNFQLSCEHCNKSKGARNSEFNNIATPFWELDSYKAFDDI